MQQAVALLAVYFLMGMLLRCCWRGLSPALPGAAFVAHSSRSCSCQLSNNIDKKVDAPRRGCTYGPEAYADCHEDCRIIEININNLSAECNRDDVSDAVITRTRLRAACRGRVLQGFRNAPAVVKYSLTTTHVRNTNYMKKNSIPPLAAAFRTAYDTPRYLPAA